MTFDKPSLSPLSDKAQSQLRVGGRGGEEGIIPRDLLNIIFLSQTSYIFPFL